MAVFSITQLLFCIALLLLLVFIVIAARTPKGPRGFFVRKCPYCLGLIWSGASICSHCRRAVPKSATTASSLIGIEKVYLGYTYVVAENGEAELKLSAGEWKKFSSTQCGCGPPAGSGTRLGLFFPKILSGLGFALQGRIIA
jgi:hypothetical protein